MRAGVADGAGACWVPVPAGPGTRREITNGWVFASLPSMYTLSKYESSGRGAFGRRLRRPPPRFSALIDSLDTSKPASLISRSTR